MRSDRMLIAAGARLSALIASEPQDVMISEDPYLHLTVEIRDVPTETKVVEARRNRFDLRRYEHPRSMRKRK